jgi:hypothetical protein
MNKARPFITVIVIFTFALIYLHQKIQINVEAYQLTRNYSIYNELVDKRDYMMYNFSREISLPQVNQWAESNNLLPVGKGRLLALNLKQKELSAQNSKLASIFNRFLGISTAASTALAKEKLDLKR